MRCGAKRIGHGVRSIEDLKLVSELAELAQEGMVLEICPTSNLQTNAVANIYEVIQELDKKGVRFGINTDNDTVSNVNIIEEYINLLENTDYTIEDLKRININAISGAFISPNEKAELKAKIMDYKESELQK